MSQLIYLDFLRRVSPIQNGNDETKPEFMLLGSFDALRVRFGANNLQTIKRLHESGHESVASVYDRQPMYLFEHDDNVCESSDSIFSTKEDFAYLPIVISILQIDKTTYAQSASASVFDLIDNIRKIVSNKIDSLSLEEQMQIKHWAVYWNLGEPDIVIVFRPKHLSPVASVLHKIRIDLDNKVSIFSSCSHCGFPYQSDPEETRNALSNWLQSETNSGKIEYLSFVNTSSGYHHLKSGEFVFGEWDYIIKQDLKNDLVDNLLQSEKYNNDPPYKTSYTLPAIALDDLGTANGQQLNDDETWINNIQTSFNEFIKTIEDMPYVVNHSIDLILSLSHTLTGLAKYLFRLFLGRYEQDLYTYTKPVFVALPLIVKSYQTQIQYLHSHVSLEESDKGEIICRLIKEFEEDTTNLISSLQHLFSVLSISPHTFMETFGSNMRSLSAANKLVDAYQGLISFLAHYFPDVIDASTIGEHQILIIPYRKSYPKHTLFYRSSSPLIRISKIEMDFPKMFRLGPSVFIILHECAHHLGDRLRPERWQEYYKACAYMAAESIVSKYLIDPLSAFLSPTSTENIQAEDAPIFFGIEDSIKAEIIELFNQSVYMKAKDAIIYIGGVLVNILDDSKASTEIELAPHYLPFFQHQLYNSYTLNLIEDTFKKAFPNDTYSTNGEIRSKLLTAINTYWISSMKDLAQRLADYVIVNGGNQYEASLLLAKYKNGNIAAEIVKNFNYIIQKKILMAGFSDLLNIFSDVYADVFAIQVLNIPSFSSYCELIQQFTGTAVNQAVVNSKNLQRIAVIGKTCFDLDVNQKREGFEELIAANNIPKWKREEIWEEWCKATGTSYFECICNYAQKCKSRMQKQLSTLHSKGVSPHLSILNQVFKSDDMNTETSFIETFWKYLMEGKK